MWEKGKAPGGSLAGSHRHFGIFPITESCLVLYLAARPASFTLVLALDGEDGGALEKRSVILSMGVPIRCCRKDRSSYCDI